MRIFIDAGHGGHDPGAVGNGMRESDITLEVAGLLGERLQQAGLLVRQSRTRDTALTINERWQAANAWGADYFISIHVNSGGGTGAETLYFKRDSLEFAQTLQDVYASETGLRNRRIWQRDDVGVLRWTNCPSVLLELAFIDSPAHNPDVETLRNRRREMALAAGKGILQFLGIKTDGGVEGGEPERFNNLDELPGWARPTIEKLVEQGLLRGDEAGLDLSRDMVRMFVVNDRAGLYG